MARILVAEDEFLIALLYREALEADGHDVCCCANGRLALAAVDQRQPDLVLTALAMPDIGGVELARALRREPRWSHIPIVLLASHPQDLVAADATLFDDVWRKFAPDKALTARVAQAMQDTRRCSAPD